MNLYLNYETVISMSRRWNEKQRRGDEREKMSEGEKERER